MAARKQTTTEQTTEERALLCQCGCGERVIRPTARFRTGHDGRLKGRLLKAAREGDAGAVEELERQGWSKFLVETAAMKRAAAKTAAKGEEA
jgi:hypothetical protein